MKNRLSLVPDYLSTESWRVPAYFEDAKWRNAVALIWIGFGLIACLLVFIAGIGITPGFASLRNFLNILKIFQYPLLIALGAAILFANGGVDLSVGATALLSGFACVAAVRAGMPLPSAILMALMVAALVGAANGLFTVAFRLPGFLVTLGMGILVKEIAIGGLGGETIMAGFAYEPVATVFWIVLAAAAVLAVILLQFPALNARASKADADGFGSRIKRIGLPYVLTAFLAGSAGIVYAARFGVATPMAGNGMEIDTLFIVIVGGGTFAARCGNPLGAIVAAFFIALSENALSMFGVESWLQETLKALVLIWAIASRFGIDLLASWLYRKRSGARAS